MSKRKVYELIPEIGLRRLDFLMTDRNISSTVLARHAGYSNHSYIARMRRGDATATRVLEAPARLIADLLRCEVDYLFQERVGRTQHTTRSATSARSRERAA